VQFQRDAESFGRITFFWPDGMLLGRIGGIIVDMNGFLLSEIKARRRFFFQQISRSLSSFDVRLQ
jgi:hypothetical protein